MVDSCVPYLYKDKEKLKAIYYSGYFENEIFTQAIYS